MARQESAVTAPERGIRGLWRDGLGGCENRAGISDYERHAGRFWPLRSPQRQKHLKSVQLPASRKKRLPGASWGEIRPIPTRHPAPESARPSSRPLAQDSPPGRRKALAPAPDFPPQRPDSGRFGGFGGAFSSWEGRNAFRPVSVRVSGRGKVYIMRLIGSCGRNEVG